MKQLRIYVDLVAPDEAMERLRTGTAGHQLIFAQSPGASVLAQAASDPQLAAADVAFGQPAPEAIASASRLKWVQVSSSSITRYDSPTFRALAAQRGLLVSNSAHVYHEACAAHALSFLLAQARQLPRALQTQTALGSPVWNEVRRRSSTLRGETVLILGYGAIGQRLTELLRPFGVSILGFRRQPRGDEPVPMLSPGQLADVLARQADHIVNILPESAETRHFFNHARFATLKPGAVFYNIGRGATVDQEALVQALRSKRLAAAWLDVTDPEPLPPGHPLLAEPNCFITPHVAGGQARESTALVQHFLDNLDRFARGQPLLDRVM